MLSTLEWGDIVFFRFDTDVAVGVWKGEMEMEGMKSMCNNAHDRSIHAQLNI